MKFCLDLPNWTQIIGDWLYNWQTLISGTLALIAARYAGILINKQIKLSEALPEIERKRKFLAARCLMPINLTEISNYCEVVAKKLAQKHNSVLLKSIYLSEYGPEIKFPHEAVVQFSKVIELSVNICLNSTLAKIISELQVLTSRISEIRRSDVRPLGDSPSNVEIYTIQAAKIGALASNLYVYCRQETELVPSSVTWKDVESQLSTWKIYDHPAISTYIERQVEKGPMFECGQ